MRGVRGAVCGAYALARAAGFISRRGSRYGGAQLAEVTQRADASCGLKRGEAAARRRLRRRVCLARSGGERPADGCAIAPTLQARSRAEATTSLSASCSPPPGGGCGLPIPGGIEAVRPTATRALLGAKPAERTHACQSCGPPRAGGFGPPHLRAISVRSAAERRGIEPSGELLPSARGGLLRYRANSFGSKPTEDSHKRTRAAARRRLRRRTKRIHALLTRAAACEGTPHAGLRGAKLRPAALKRESVLGPKPAEDSPRAHASCVPPLRKAARRSLRDREVSQQSARPSADRFAVASRLRASAATTPPFPKKSPKNELLRPIKKGLGTRNGSRGPLFRQVLPYRMRSAARTSISSRKIAREASHTKKSAASGKAAVGCGAANEAVAAASAKRAFRRKK